MNEMGAPYNSMELASFMSCSKGYVSVSLAKIVNMDKISGDFQMIFPFIRWVNVEFVEAMQK